ncbi:MAG: hypothetical protein LUD39_05495, partial [Opitutae bacterium]|nr:hypothetical protein [Opitutae bacterium]
VLTYAFVFDKDKPEDVTVYSLNTATGEAAKISSSFAGKTIGKTPQAGDSADDITIGTGIRTGDNFVNYKGFTLTKFGVYKGKFANFANINQAGDVFPKGINVLLEDDDGRSTIQTPITDSLKTLGVTNKEHVTLFAGNQITDKEKMLFFGTIHANPLPVHLTKLENLLKGRNTSKGVQAYLLADAKRCRNAQAAELLLKYGANPNVHTYTGDPMLANCTPEVAEVMLNYGADPNLLGEHGTPLDSAFEQGNVKLGMIIRSFGGDFLTQKDNVEKATSGADPAKPMWKEVLNTKKTRVATGKVEIPTPTASSFDNTVVNVGSAGLQPSEKKDSPVTLEDACRECDAEAFEKLTADMGNRASEEIRRYHGENGKTLAHELCSNEIKDLNAFVKILDKLVAAAPLLLSQKDVNGETPLHYAIYGSEKREIGEKDYMIRFPNEKTFGQRRFVAEELLKRKPTLVNVAGNSGNSPLHCAVARKYMNKTDGKVEIVVSGDPQLVDLLLKHGAKVDAKNSKGQTPLLMIFDTEDDTSSHVITSRIVDTAKLLISKKANVMASNNNKSTILYLAVGEFDMTMKDENDTSFFDLLLKSGANINAKNKFGMTPLDFAEGISFPSSTSSGTASATVSDSVRKLESLKKWIRAHGGKNGKVKKKNKVSDD